MRNLKRALSLLLSSTMVLGMVVMGGSAAGYQDVDASNDNQEAIEVLQAVGIMSGVDDKGNFNPDGGITRNEMAVVMAHLLNLDYDYYRGINTFSDVPEWAAPYVAACVAEGVTAGVGNGLYGGDQKITAAQAGLMVMKALGYFQNQEDFGGDWQVATIRQASYINLFDKVNSNAESALTRGQVAQLVLNGLKSDMVSFTGDKGVQIGDVTVGYHAEYTAMTNAAVKYNSINTGKTDIAGNNQYYIQLGEELYNGDLKLQNTTDVFGRPSRYWEYKGAEVGTYVKNELLRKEYTAKVTGKDLYELLGTSTIDEYGLSVVIDGVDKDSVNSAVFDKTSMVRSNTKAVGDTGNGTLTQVYVDTQSKQITISIINTYLAKANENYDTKDEDVSLTIYEVDNKGSISTPIYVKADGLTVPSYTVSVDDYDVANVAENDLFLVTLANGEIQSLQAPQILSETSITNFKLHSYVTADGKQYDYADTAMYDDAVLDKYDNQNMKDVTYNVILDNYGYLIGLELNQDPDKYVFLTGLDGKYSNLSIKEADANVIFVDGTMSTVTVNMDKSVINDASKNLSQLNTWCTYTVDSKGVYTLKEVSASITGVDVAQYAQDVGAAGKEINEKNISLPTDVASTFVYGNDDTVYINVELDKVIVDDNRLGGANRWIIDDVESVTTGVKNVNLAMTNLANTNNYIAPAAEIYTLYGDDGYVIAAVTIGENEGTSSNYVYVTSSNVEQEALSGSNNTRAARSGGEWTWTREVYADGQLKKLTEVGSSLDILNTMVQGEWYEVKYDANGNVRKAEAVKFSDAGDKFVDKVEDVAAGVNNFDTVLLSDISTVTKLTFENGTLYTAQTPTDKGFSVRPEVKVLLSLASATGSEFDETKIYSGYEGLRQAIRDMNSQGTVTAGMIEVSAILQNGGATTIVINDKTPAGTTSTVTPGQPGKDTVNGYNVHISLVDTPVTLNTVATRAALAVTNAGYKNAMPVFLTGVGSDSANGSATGYLMAYDQAGAMVYFTVTYSNYWTVKVDGVVKDTVLHGNDSVVYNNSTAIDGKGTGYLTGTTTYAPYTTKPDINSVSASVAITTGYAKINKGSASFATDTLTYTVNTDDSLAISKVTQAGSDFIFKVADGLTATYTTGSTASETADQNITLTLKDSASATLYTSTQMMAKANYNVAGKTLTWTINTSSFTKDIDSVTAPAQDVPASRTITYDPVTCSAANTSTGDLTITLNGVSTALDGETVTVSVVINGTADTATALTMSTTNGTGGAWTSSTLPAGLSFSGGKLSITNGVKFDNVYVTYTFAPDGAGNVTVSGTVA